MRMGGVHSLWKHHSGVTIMRWSVVSKIRDLSARNRDRCLMRCAAPRNNTLCIMQSIFSSAARLPVGCRRRKDIVEAAPVS